MVAFMGYRPIVKLINKRREAAQHIETMLPFTYFTTNGKIFTPNDLKTDRATLFVYFNSECDHCQNEASQIQANIAKFHDYQLVFVSFEEKSKIIAFAKNYKLDHYDNVTFLLDKRAAFSTNFFVTSFPTVLIYNEDKKLIEKIKGQTKVETILKKLEDQN